MADVMASAPPTTQPAPSGGSTKLPAWDMASSSAVDVDAAELTKRYTSGELHVVGDHPYPMVGPTGAVYEIPGRGAGEAIRGGYRFATREEVAATNAQAPGMAWRAAAEGAAEAVPGGTALLTSAGADPVDIKARQEAHPVARVAGMTAGVVGGGMVLGAAELPTVGTMLGGELAAGAAAEALGAARGATLAGKMVTAAAGEIPAGVVYGVGNLANESALGDANFTAEAMMAHAGVGAFVSAALGGAGGALGHALEGRMAARAVNRVLPKSANAAEVEELATRAGVDPEWFNRPRGASPKGFEGARATPAEADSLLGDLKSGAQEFTPGKGWGPRTAEDVTVPNAATADTVPSMPRATGRTMEGELETSPHISVREPTMDGEVLSSGPTPKALGPGQPDIWDQVMPKPGARGIVEPDLNVSGAFGDMEAGVPGAAQGPSGLEHDFVVGAQSFPRPNPENLTPEQRALWDHYQSLGKDPAGHPGYVPGAAPNFSHAPYEPPTPAAGEPLVTPAPGAAAGAAAPRSVVPPWLKSALMDYAAYHVAGPLGPIGRRAVGAYLRSESAAPVLAKAMAAIQRVGAHLDRAATAFVQGGQVVAEPTRRAITVATTRMLAAKTPADRRSALEARATELAPSSNPDDVGVPTAVSAHMPTTSGLVSAKVWAIQSQLLKTMPRVPSVTMDGRPNWGLVQDADVRRFAAVDAALQDPLSIADTLHRGHLPHPSVLPAIRAAYPGLYQRMTTSVIAALAANPNVPYASAVRLHLAFGLGGHATLRPEAISAQQAAITPAPPSGGASPRPRGRAPSPRAEAQRSETE